MSKNKETCEKESTCTPGFSCTLPAGHERNENVHVACGGDGFVYEVFRVLPDGRTETIFFYDLSKEGC
jgi:hypothetical protein